MHSTYKHLLSVCNFPFGEWALRHLLILFRLWHLFFFKSQCCRSSELLSLTFVFLCTPLCLKCDRKSSVVRAQMAPFPPVNHKWTGTCLHLSWLSVSVSFFSGRRCRSTMWRQVSSTREIIWTARCLTATATFWPASLWRSSLVRFLYLSWSVKLLKHEPAASRFQSQEAQSCSFLRWPVFPEASASFSLSSLVLFVNLFPRQITWPWRTPPEWLRSDRDSRSRTVNLTPAETQICWWNVTLLPGKLATQYTVMASSSDRAAS